MGLTLSEKGSRRGKEAESSDVFAMKISASFPRRLRVWPLLGAPLARACPRTAIFRNFIANFSANSIELAYFGESSRQSSR
jgi:hypothetical protein